MAKRWYPAVQLIFQLVAWMAAFILDPYLCGHPRCDFRVRYALARVCLWHGWYVSMHSRMLHCPVGSTVAWIKMQRWLWSFPCPCMDIHASRSSTPMSFAYIHWLGKKIGRDSQGLSSFGLFRRLRQGHNWSVMGRGELVSEAVP